MLLYRPVGLKELELVAESGFKRFPPRLAHQPIFYPVLNREYAIQIARDWNTQDSTSGYAGFVTRFEVDDAYVSGFPVQEVGQGGLHQELWVPAEELNEFNRHIRGIIEVTDSYYGNRFAGDVDPTPNIKDKEAIPVTILPHVEGPVTVINVITVTPEEQQTRIDMMLHTARETMSRQPGFLSAEVLKSVDGRRVAVCARWESVEAFRAVFGQPEVLAFMQQAVTQVPMEWHAYQAVETVKSPAFESGY